MSTRGSVELIRRAKDRGIRVTAEATPHHFTLTHVACEGYNTNAKMNPPLRSGRDREAILEGLADGTLEILASDHAPHCGFEKEVEFDYAPFGVTGLETELALSLMQLYHRRLLTLPDLIAKFTVAPARLLRLAKGTLAVGAEGDVTVLDPDREWVFTAGETAGKSRNSPFHGWRLRGQAVLTVVGGRIVWPA